MSSKLRNTTAQILGYVLHDVLANSFMVPDKLKSTIAKFSSIRFPIIEQTTFYQLFPDFMGQDLVKSKGC